MVVQVRLLLALLELGLVLLLLLLHLGELVTQLLELLLGGSVLLPLPEFILQLLLSHQLHLLSCEWLLLAMALFVRWSLSWMLHHLLLVLHLLNLHILLHLGLVHILIDHALVLLVGLVRI